MFDGGWTRRRRHVKQHQPQNQHSSTSAPHRRPAAAAWICTSPPSLTSDLSHTPWPFMAEHGDLDAFALIYTKMFNQSFVLKRFWLFFLKIHTGKFQTMVLYSTCTKYYAYLYSLFRHCSTHCTQRFRQIIPKTAFIVCFIICNNLTLLSWGQCKQIQTKLQTASFWMNGYDWLTRLVLGLEMSYDNQ